MIKTHAGCPVCHTAIYDGCGCSTDPKIYYTCENGHKWTEYTVQEIMKGADDGRHSDEEYLSDHG